MADQREQRRQSKERQSLLWTDDDAPDRFLFEIGRIETRGWKVDWALDIWEAAQMLASRPFNALILDQMLPFHIGENAHEPVYKETQVWGGCVLLRWLRGKGPPDKAPLDSIEPDQRLRRLHPQPENARIPVIVVSAFYDEDVLTAMRDASDIDKTLEISSKTTNIAEIEELLGATRAR